MKHDGLEAKLDRSTEGSRIDPHVRADNRAYQVSLRCMIRMAGNKPKYPIPYKGQDDGHIETIRPKGEYATIAEEYGLNEQGGGNPYDGGPRIQ
jgi:hypothetical protein